MTLLTQPMNSKVKNYDFSVKKMVYKKMKLPMTTEIGQLDKIDEKYIKNRHIEMVDYLVGHLGL